MFALERSELQRLTLADARREGFYSVHGALQAWQRAFGAPSDPQPVWVVGFLYGDQSEVVQADTPIYLRGRTRDGSYRNDYTLRTDQALMEAGSAVEVVQTMPGAGERARILAIAQRVGPHREALRQIARPWPGAAQ